MSFDARLRERAAELQSWLCVGLDPDIDRLPDCIQKSPDGIVDFCETIIAITSPFACAFKIQFAFFEALGPAGWDALADVRAAVPRDIPVIADAKRGDIGNTSRAYAHAVFDALDFDAVTVSPYLGWDGLGPFLERRGRGVFVLCRTSNPGSNDPQELVTDGDPLYLHIAREAGQREALADVGLVVAANQLGALRRVRALDEDRVLLVPGIGEQGGDPLLATRAAANRQGENALVSASRQVAFASRGKDFARAAERAARVLAMQTRTSGAPGVG